MVAREPELSVRAGAGAELECVAHGNPAPSIRWRRIREDKVSQVCSIARKLTLKRFSSVIWIPTALQEWAL